MFELPPYWDCPKCGETSSLGVLLVHSNSYTRRCKHCQTKTQHWLNDLDKKVIYIDQFALSEMTKVEQPQYTSSLKPYWIVLRDRIRRLLLFQQAIFPDSNVHQDESLLSRINDDIREQYEAINGEVSLVRDTTITRRQLMVFARSWIAGNGAPTLKFNVDDILRGKRNAWLSPLRVSVRTDYSRFADGIRASRDAVATEMTAIFEQWIAAKDPFRTVVERESAAFGQAHLQGIIETPVRIKRALASNDELALVEATRHESNIIFGTLNRMFEQHGVPEGDCVKKVREFLLWDGLKQLPSNNISAHLYAAMARKAAAGQRRPPSRGMTYDVRVIANYAPYLDAMFIDNECAGYLSEEPLRSLSNLPIRARIFCLNTRDQFLQYLQNLELNADAEIKKQAIDLYGINA